MWDTDRAVTSCSSIKTVFILLDVASNWDSQNPLCPTFALDPERSAVAADPEVYVSRLLPATNGPASRYRSRTRTPVYRIIDMVGPGTTGRLVRERVSHFVAMI